MTTPETITPAQLIARSADDFATVLPSHVHAPVWIRVAQGWAGVQGAEGSALPFSPEAFAQMLNLPGLEQLAFDAYLVQQGARAKN